MLSLAIGRRNPPLIKIQNLVFLRSKWIPNAHLAGDVSFREKNVLRVLSIQA